jgi:integrase
VRGHIRKRGKDTWQLKYEIDRIDGQRKTRYMRVRGSKREAMAELNRLLAQAQSGGYVEPHKLTVLQHLRQRVSLWRANETISARTAQRYEGLIKHQIEPFPIASRPLQKLTSGDVEEWHTILRTKGRHDGKGGVAHRTIHHVHKILKRSLDDAVRHKLVARNIATEQRPPKINAKPMRILTAEEVKNLPATLDGLPICAPALVALHTGMRRGELLALRWPDVDLDRKVIKVRAALEQTVELGIRFKAPKTKAGVRSISLADDTVAVLRDHRRQQLEFRLALGLGKAPDNNSLVFPLPGTERPWGPDSFSAAWGDLNLSVSFHELRHTHASILIAKGVPITEIAHRLGHASAATTLSVYAHLYEQDGSRAVAAINEALGG